MDKSVPLRIGGLGLEPPSSLWKPVGLQWSDLSPHTLSPWQPTVSQTTSSAVDDGGTELCFFNRHSVCCHVLYTHTVADMVHEEQDHTDEPAYAVLPRVM